MFFFCREIYFVGTSFFLFSFVLFSFMFFFFSQDLEARAAHLEERKANLDDPGPLHDCVVWKGGGGVDGGGEEERWWAAVDIKEDGDLTQAVAMTDFDKVPMCAAARQRVCCSCFCLCLCCCCFVEFVSGKALVLATIEVCRTRVKRVVAAAVVCSKC